MRPKPPVFLLLAVLPLALGFGAGWAARAAEVRAAREALADLRSTAGRCEGELETFRQSQDALTAALGQFLSGPLASARLPDKGQAHLAYLTARAAERLEQQVLESWVQWGYAVGSLSAESHAEAEALEREWLSAALAPLATDGYIAQRLEHLAAVQRGGEGEFTFPDWRWLERVEPLEGTDQRVRVRFVYHESLPKREWNACPCRRKVDEVVTLERVGGLWKLAAIDREYGNLETVR